MDFFSEEYSLAMSRLLNFSDPIAQAVWIYSPSILQSGYNCSPCKVSGLWRVR